MIHVQGFLKLKLPTTDVEKLIKHITKEEIYFLLRYAQGSGRGKETTFDIPLVVLESVILQFCTLLLGGPEETKKK